MGARKIRSVALPSQASSCGGMPTIVAGYTGFLRCVIAVIWNRVGDAVHSAVPVLVASKTDESISATTKLAVVPYGEGEIKIARQRGRQAAIVSHYMGGSVSNERASIDAGSLTVTAKSHNSLGKPLEWIEVTIS